VPTYVALFRGINVGGRQIVRMADLKELHQAPGFQKVVTSIQSGNVVFTSDDADAAALSKRIEEAFAQRFGFRSSVMVRTVGQLDEIIKNNPFRDQPEKEPKWVLVLFLANYPASTAEEDLRRAYSGPEEFHLIGQEMFIYYPEGMGRSKLTTALLEKKLQTAGTGRNWNTTLKLRELMKR
jgi:uncharacterized protein (DUF1697 family)